MKTIPSAIFSSWALLTVFLASGCGDRHPEAIPAADEFIFDCTRKPDGGTTIATDESFMAIINREAATGLVNDDRQGPQLLSPASGATISASSPPVFTFRASLAAEQPVMPAGPAGACHVQPTTLFQKFVRFVAPVSTAHAHCGAVNGENFLFRLTVQNAPEPLYTAILSVTTFTPDPTLWARRMSAHLGKTINLTLARAFFLQGNIVEGPYVRTESSRFVVGP